MFLGFLILFILFMIWVLPKIWRGIKMILRKIRGKKEPVEPPVSEGPGGPSGPVEAALAKSTSEVEQSG